MDSRPSVDAAILGESRDGAAMLERSRGEREPAVVVTAAGLPVHLSETSEGAKLKDGECVHGTVEGSADGDCATDQARALGRGQQQMRSTVYS